MSGIYRTRNQGVAALLRYLNGPETHRKTFMEQPTGTTFLFTDPNGECAAISRAYHGEDGGTGFAVADAKTLIDNFIELRRTMTNAIRNGGTWENKQ